MEGVQGFTAGSESLFVAGANCPQVRPNTVTTDANGNSVIWQCSLVKMATPAEYACSDGKTYMASQLGELRLSTNEPTITNK
jgi:hypothetical protein